MRKSTSAGKDAARPSENPAAIEAPPTVVLNIGLMLDKEYFRGLVLGIFVGTMLATAILLRAE